jgi:guanosine-3',5'-bis(diphosphate) 3'-pyrophosphohydrolase
VETFTEIAPAIGTSPAVQQAHQLLLAKHAGQRQKVNGRPYVEHPIAVATGVGEAGFDEEMVVAALLHDVVEDSDATVAEIRQRFGDRVARLVEAMTDEVELDPYERRKALHREQIAASGIDAAAIFAADKLNNVRALRAAYAEEGEAVVRRFKQPLDTKLNVWVADAELVAGYGAAIPYGEALRGEVDGLRSDRLRLRRS